MRVWLAILVLGVIVTGGASVYLVEHPPAGYEGGAPLRSPARDSGESERGDDDAPASPFPLTPTGLEPSLGRTVSASGNASGPRPHATAPAPNATTPPPPSGTSPPPPSTPSVPPPTEGGSGGNGTGGTGGNGTGGDTGNGTGGTGGGTDGGTGGNETGDTGGDDTGNQTAPPPTPAPAPTPRSWSWVHDFAMSASPTAFLVPTGLKELEYKVVFAPKDGSVVAGTSVSANLVGPDSVTKIPCASPAVLVGQHVCGPFRTPALAGRWEVQYSSTSPIQATLTLRELP